MAPGYVIALALEGAGLVGLVIGILAMRAERRARADGLRGFLRSGNTGSATGGAPRAAAVSAPLRVAVTPGPAAAAPDAFAARSALRRAFA